MSSIVENECEELSQVTEEILALTENLKKSIKESMVVGERSIIKGITLFEEVIKELNPDKIDDGIISMIISYVSIVLYKQEEQMQRVDNKVHYGVSQCYMLIDLYNKKKKRELVLN
jgi:hypothetical protein